MEYVNSISEARALLSDEFVYGPGAGRGAVRPSTWDAMMAEGLAPAPPRPWRGLARDEQLPPPDTDWLVWLLLAGRGFGKSFTGSNALVEWATEEIGDYAAIGPTFGDTRKIMTEGPSGLLRALGDDLANYNKSDFILYLKNGSRIILASADVPDRIRGLNLRGAWLDELAAMRNSRGLWDEALMPALRIGTQPRAVITTTPRRGSPVLAELVDRFEAEDKQVRLTRGRTLDNAKNLSKAFIRAIYARYGGTTLGQQELDGELLDDAEGALISSELVAETRVSSSAVPELWSVVVAVDPAVTSNATSDWTGIIVVGLGPAPYGWVPRGGALHGGGQPHLYFLQDRSLRATPDGWARRALETAEVWGADKIVGEVNQGGDMVEYTIRSTAQTLGIEVPFIQQVRASRAKAARAEPLVPVFEQGRAHFVDRLRECESEWTTWVPHESPESPDRLDASVWGSVGVMPALGLEKVTEVALLA